jgi:hypothetical protein
MYSICMDQSPRDWNRSYDVTCTILGHIRGLRQLCQCATCLLSEEANYHCKCGLALVDIDHSVLKLTRLAQNPRLQKNRKAEEEVRE